MNPAQKFFGKNNFYRLLFLTAFIFCSSVCKAQLSLDSLMYNLSQKPTFFFQFDATNSFVSGSGANAIGVKAGLDFGKRIKFGAGYYTMVSDIVESKYVARYDTFYNAKLQMNYYTTFIDYVLYDRNRWQFSFLNQFGIGNSYFWYYPNKSENKRKTETISSKPVILYEPAVMGQFRIMKWFGVGFGTGYRIMILTNKEIDHKLSSPIYALRLKLYLDEIYATIWPHGLFPKKKEKSQ
jgi:hypothetical protein